MCIRDRYKDHPALAMWHISNEYGGECHCENCQKRFRAFLKDRYGDIETLNRSWWNAFWAHQYSCFEEIESPTTPSWMGERESLGLKLAWRRFCSWQTVDFYLNEIEPLKRITPDVPCTTNMMGTYTGIDYFDLGKVLDLSLIHIFMTGGGPLNSTYVFGLHLYNSAFRFSKFGYASALAWVLFLITMVLSMLVMGSSKRWVHYGEEV